MSHSVWTGSLQILINCIIFWGSNTNTLKKKEATACDVLFTPKLHCNRDGRFPVNVALDYLWRGNNKFQTKILSYFNSLLKRINENFALKTSVCDITLENLLVSSHSDVFESALKNKKLSFRKDEFDSILSSRTLLLARRMDLSVGKWVD